MHCALWRAVCEGPIKTIDVSDQLPLLRCAASVGYVGYVPQATCRRGVCCMLRAVGVCAVGHVLCACVLCSRACAVCAEIIMAISLQFPVRCCPSCKIRYTYTTCILQGQPFRHHGLLCLARCPPRVASSNRHRMSRARCACTHTPPPCVTGGTPGCRSGACRLGR